ncbi:MAG: replication factor C large subunit [Candidatus Micrarchaeaceae archaeon]
MGIVYDPYDVGSLEEIIGNEHAIKRMRDFCRDCNKGIKRMPLLISGPSGTGKSAAVHLLAKENNWNVVELNAGDYRDANTIKGMLMSAATSRPLMGGRNLILLDEIDEMVARFDKGAPSAIGELIAKAKNPIILTANDMWDQSITFLRGKTEAIEFKRLATDTIQIILRKISKRHSIAIKNDAIEMIAKRANGDARGAINDLSIMDGAGDEDIMEVIGLRDRKMDIFNVLDRIFLTNSISAPLRAVANSGVSNDMLIRWIEENIPKRYQYGEDLSDAFESLSYASIFSSRAARSQYYTYWRYMNVLMSSGVALSKRHAPSSARGYSFPNVIKELSTTKASRNQDRLVAEKLQRTFHSSTRKIIRNELVLLSASAARAVKSGTATKDEVIEYLSSAYILDGKEAEYILGRNS